MPSFQLIEILNVTGGLFLNLSLALPKFRELTEEDFIYIFGIISKPANWDTMSEKDKIIYFTRFSNGQTLREVVKNANT